MGKRLCDGSGNTIKRVAASSSLQQPNDQIMTPCQLFEFETLIFSIHQLSIKKKKSDLEERFMNASTIKGTHKLQCFYSDINDAN